MIDMTEVLNCIKGSKEIEHMLTTDYDRYRYPYVQVIVEKGVTLIFMDRAMFTSLSRQVERFLVTVRGSCRFKP